MHSTIKIVAADSQHLAQGALKTIGVIIAFCFVIALAITAVAVVTDHVKGVPRFIREYTGQFAFLVAMGPLAGVVLTAMGVNPAIAFPVGIGAAIVFIVWVAA